MKCSRLATVGVIFCAAACAAPPAQAAYPDRPVHLVVSSDAGGGIDSVARLIASGLSDKWHQPVLVENKPGANTVLAEVYVAHAAPDGYTILITNTQRTLNAAQNKSDAGYDMANGFAAVTQVGAQAYILVSNPSKLSVKSLAEMVTDAKAQPGKLSYGDSGQGSAQDLAMKLLAQKTGTQILEVPYKTVAEAMVGLMGGEVDLMLGSIVQVAPQIKAGTLTALGVADDVRDPTLPDVPTVAQALGMPSFVFGSWYGIFAPAGTPKDVVTELSADIVSVIKEPDVQDRLTKSGLRVIASNPDQFAKVLAQETANWRSVMQAFPSK